MSKNYPAVFPFALAATLALTGCSSSDEVTDPTSSQAAAAAGSSAASAAVTAPLADLAANLSQSMLSQGGASAQGGVAAAVASCPATFDLGNGITGTCSEAPVGTFNFAFAGTTNARGQTVAVTGTMVAVSGASGYAVDLDANATWPNGSAVLSLTGTVDPGGSGPGTASFTVDVTVTRAGQLQIDSRVVVTPTGLSISVSSGGVGIAIALNRETMTGTIAVAGVVIANLSIEGGCALVDFIDPITEDRTVCPS